MTGLDIRHGALDAEEQARLLGTVELALAGVRPEERRERVRIRRFGWDYFGTGGRLEDAPDALYTMGLDPAYFESVTVNEYEPLHGLAAHIDSDRFGEPVVTVSLGAPATMLFVLGPQSLCVPLSSGTMLSMSGPARWEWQHSVLPDNSGTRWSVVYRHRN